MTDADHAAVLRRFQRVPRSDREREEQAAIERAIELLERQHRIDNADGAW